jgi:transmembrane sensor
MIILVLLIGHGFLGNMSHHTEVALKYFQTGIGEKREVVLGDGSRMVLNTKSTVMTKFSDDQRLVEITEGEVFFDVVKDRERPFLVCASDGEIRVVGTAFNVLNRRKKVSVGVIRGRVQVRKTGRHEYEPNGKVMLEAGQGTSYTESGEIKPPGLRRADEVLSWQREKLFFHSEPLSDVLRQLEDYYPVHFILEDSSIAGQRLTGTFNNRNLDEILDSIQTAFDLKTEHQHALIVLKTKRRKMR